MNECYKRLKIRDFHIFSISFLFSKYLIKLAQNIFTISLELDTTELRLAAIPFVKYLKLAEKLEL